MPSSQNTYHKISDSNSGGQHLFEESHVWSTYKQVFHMIKKLMLPRTVLSAPFKKYQLTSSHGNNHGLGLERNCERSQTMHNEQPELLGKWLGREPSQSKICSRGLETDKQSCTKTLKNEPKWDMNLKENKEDVGNEEGKKRTGSISPSTATALKKYGARLFYGRHCTPSSQVPVA